MEFRKQKSIYQQIADRLMDQLLAGTPPADERMPSVRDVAVSLGVNPNTVMRSFDYLQQEGIIYNRRGVGYFASPDAKEKILAIQRLSDIVYKILPNRIKIIDSYQITDRSRMREIIYAMTR